MVEERTYLDGMIKEYKAIGKKGVMSYISLPEVVVLGPYEKALKVHSSGGIKEDGPGRYNIWPGQSLYVLNTRAATFEIPLRAMAKDRLGIDFTVNLVCEPEDIRKAINAPEDLDLILTKFLNSKAIDLVYAKEDIWKAIDEKTSIENGLEDYARKVLHEYGFGTGYLKSDMIVPDDFSDVARRKAMVGPTMEAIMGEWKVTGTNELTRSYLDAQKNRIDATTQIDLDRQRWEMENKIRKQRALNEVEVLATHLENVKRPSLELQYDLVGKLLAGIAEKYGKDAPQVVWAITGGTFGQGHPVTQAIAEQLGLEYRGGGIAKFSEKTGIPPSSAMWADAFRNIDKAGFVNIGGLDNFMSQLAVFDKKLADKLYGQ